MNGKKGSVNRYRQTGQLVHVAFLPSFPFTSPSSLNNVKISQPICSFMFQDIKDWLWNLYKCTEFQDWLCEFYPMSLFQYITKMFFSFKNKLGNKKEIKYGNGCEWKWVREEQQFIDSGKTFEILMIAFKKMFFNNMKK